MLKAPVEAVIFDMDGLLLDTERVYVEALQRAAREMGHEMSLAFCHSTSGVPGPERNAMVQELLGPDFSIPEFRERFQPIVRELLAERIPLKTGVLEMLDFLKDRGLPAAVATSARRPTAEKHLGQTGLLPRLAAVATRDDVPNAKPAPDVYLEAARRLGVPPSRCIAFEDSNVGALAAHAAGTMTFVVPDIAPPTEDVRARCAGVLPDLHAALAMLRTSLARISPPRA